MQDKHKAILIGSIGVVCAAALVALGFQVPKIIKAIKD